MQKQILKRNDLIYPQLSYKIVGILYEVYNELGGGYKEKYYQKALVIGLNKSGVMFKEQIYSPLFFNGSIIGKQYLDFLIENKLVLEIKSGEIFNRRNIEQVYSYLVANNLKLGILTNFTKTGLRSRRILNVNS